MPQVNAQTLCMPEPTFTVSSSWSSQKRNKRSLASCLEDTAGNIVVVTSFSFQPSCIPALSMGPSGSQHLKERPWPPLSLTLRTRTTEIRAKANCGSQSGWGEMCRPWLCSILSLDKEEMKGRMFPETARGRSFLAQCNFVTFIDPSAENHHRHDYRDACWT